MSEQQKPEVGSLSWFDLTIPNAEEVRDFYSKVIGWKSEPVPMEKGKYNDFNMIAPESDLTVTGVCHAQGVNKNLPPQWLLYLHGKMCGVVENLRNLPERQQQTLGLLPSGESLDLPHQVEPHHHSLQVVQMLL